MRYTDNLFGHNGFESDQNTDIEFQLDVLIFLNDTDEEKQNTLEEAE